MYSSTFVPNNATAGFYFPGNRILMCLKCKFMDGKWHFLFCIEETRVLALGLAWLKRKNDSSRKI
jgi:hypothetical protein